jgi:hypothetical protein
VQALPGSTIGWGYALQNQSSSLWLVPSDLNAGTFLNGTPALLFDFPVLGPGASATKDFDPGTSTGLYQLTWDALAPLGFVNAGTLHSARNGGVATRQRVGYLFLMHPVPEPPTWPL